MTNLCRDQEIDLNLTDVRFVSLPKKDVERKRTSLKEGDVLVSITAELGKIGIVPQNIGDAYINQHTALLRTDKALVVPRFLAQLLALSKTNKRLNQLNDAGAKAGLNLSTLAKFQVSIPPLVEQKKIADFLKSVDVWLNNLEAQKRSLETFKKGMMQKLFTQKVRFEDVNGNNYPEWKEFELREIGSSYSGLTGKAGDDFGQGKPFVTYKQIFDESEINTTNFSLVTVSDNEKQNKVEYGDVLFTVSSETPSEVGYASVFLSKNSNPYLNSFSFGYRPNSVMELIPEFSKYLFRSPLFRKEAIKLAQGSTRYNVSKIAFMKIVVNIPASVEQQKIASFFTSLDKLIAAKSEQVAKVEQWKKGLMQKLFV